MIAGVEARDGEALDEEPDQHHDGQPQQGGKEEAAGALGDEVREVGAEHVEGPVREVQHSEHAEDDGQAARDEEEEQAVLDAVEQLHRDERRRHVAMAQPKAGSSASFCARPRTSSRPPFTSRT